MPPSIRTTLREIDIELAKLDAIVGGLNVYGASTQGLIAEIVMIRVAAIMEIYLAELAYKLAAGAAYVDGSRPRLHKSSPSKSAARNAMLSHGRRSRLMYLKWTSSHYIKQSAGTVIDLGEEYFLVCDRFGSNIREIFDVRHYIAHRNGSTAAKYSLVVRNHYGVSKRMNLKLFLLSPRTVGIPNLKRYISEASVILRGAVKG